MCRFQNGSAIDLSLFMKKLNEIFTYQRLYESFKECKKGTIWKGSVIDFNINYVEKISQLQEDLLNGTYEPYPDNVNYISERGKVRKIHSQHIRDRVVHKIINQDILIPLLQKQFIWHNTASQKNKGMDFAMDKFKCHLNRAYRKWGKDFYILTIDMKKYFDSIPHHIIEDILNKKIKDKELLDLCILTMKRKVSHGGVISIYNENTGLGLGSEMNQTYALLCLDEFDHIIKEKFKIKEYSRYMDDMQFMHNDKNKLMEVLEFANNYFEKNDMSANKKKTSIFPIKNGVTFLGFKWRITESGHVVVYPKKQTIFRFKRKIRKLKKKIDEGVLTLEDVKNSYASMKGHIKRCNCNSVVNGLDKYFSDVVLKDEECGNDT